MIRTLDYASPTRTEPEPPVLRRLRVLAILTLVLCLMHCATLSLSTVLAWGTKHRAAYTLDARTSLDAVSTLALDWQRAAHLRETIWLGISLLGLLLTIRCLKPSSRLRRIPMLVFAASFGLMLLIEIASLALLELQLPIVIHPRGIASWECHYSPEWIPMTLMAGSAFLVSALILVRAWVLNTHRKNAQSEEDNTCG